MAGFWTRLTESLRTNSRNKRTKPDSRRRLRVEMLEGRQLMAANITGTVFNDVTDNATLDASDPRLSGVTIQLVRDGGNAIFDNGGGDDTIVTTNNSAATTGVYAFNDITTAGLYFVVQTTPVSGLVQRASQRVQAVTISAGDIAGVSVRTIDTFDQTAQLVTATDPGSTPTSSSLDAPEAVGGERDIFVSAVSGTVSAEVDTPSTTNYLAFNVGAGANGTKIITYDGQDNDATALATNGLGGVDFTSSGTGNAFRFAIGGEAGNTLTITINSGANASAVTVNVPVTVGALPTATLDVPFSSFVTTAGTGADLTNVGAIIIQVAGPDAGDAIIDNVGIVGPTVKTVNIANLPAMTIGDLLWVDTNNDGVKDAAETGIAGVTVQLHTDTNANGSFDNGVDLLAATTTTLAGGAFSFGNLLPGSYLVLVPISQFGVGQPLAGHASSTGNDPAPDPDNNINNDDNGTLIATVGVATAAITLASGTEPINDGDTDTNTNLSVDLGFAPLIDLQIAKTANPTSAVAGSQLTYTLSVTNNGPEDATGVIASDPLPAGVTFVSTTASQGTSTNAAGTITANLGTLANGASATVTIIVAVPTTGIGTLTNNVTVVGVGQETDLTNNDDSLITPIVQRTDLRITKTDTPDPANAGGQLTYTLSVTNDGPSNATGVSISDVLPSDVTFVSATASQGTATNAAGTITGTLGALASGASATVTVIVAVPAGSTATTVNNTATVTGNETDPVTTNNTSTTSTTVQRNIDLRVTKADTPDPVVTGNNLTYTMSVTNDGPSTATNVVLSDTLPAGVTFGSVTSTVGTGTQAAGVVTVNIGTLAPAASATVTLIVGVNANAAATLSNTATVTATETDTDPTDNSATTTTATQKQIDLAITKVDTADPIIAGQNLTYTITVTNNGPSDATGVTVTDALPTGLTFVSATPSQGTATNTGNNINAALGNIANGANATITVIATVAATAVGTLNNTATVTGNETDTNTTNNSDSETTTVNRQVDVRVTKTDSADPVIAGNQLTYTIIVTNDGPSTATNVVMTDALPTGVSFVSGTSTAGTVTNASGTVTANIGTLNPGATATVTVVGAVAGTVRGTLTNTATVTRTETDTNAANNTATATTVVNPQLDLTITKTDAVDPVAPGGTVVYTIVVTNSGPSTATNVRVTDTLPSQLTFASGSATAGTVNNTGNAVTATIGNLASGASATVTINATVNAGAQAQITNTATAVADETETNATNNSATQTTVLAAPANISGTVYVDRNRNGVQDTGETGIAGVTITLTGTDFLGAAVSRTQQTTAAGAYDFTGLLPGTYTVRQTQPTDFVDGVERAGTNGSTASANDTFTVNLAGGNNSTGNTFGETVLDISKRRFLASNN